MNTNQLWKERLGQHVKMVSRYMRLIFNDHLAFALIFFVAGFAYFYQQWLETVPQNFPVAWMMAVVIGLLLTHSPVRTFFREADTVFLLPVENKLKPYIRNSLVYSFVMQSYWLAIFVFAFAPLYLTIYPEIPASYLFAILLGVLLVKVGNLFATWYLDTNRDPRLTNLDRVVRLVINVLFVYFLVNGVMFNALAAALLILGVAFLNYWNIYKKFSLPWDQLVEKEDARLQFFYRIANMSTDVPHIKHKPKKRHRMAGFAKKNVDYNQESTYLYLYALTFVRSGDYLGMYLRLVALAIFFALWIPIFWAKVVFAMLILFITGFQFITIYNHHKRMEWLDIYPVSHHYRKKAVHQLILVLMSVKIVIVFFAFYFGTGFLDATIYGGIAIAFTVLFEHFYVKKRIQTLTA
ncbi:ABC transporter permease [Halalkalibacillus halophilus]|uniref:ABC transporter permease n=1 Tax=Halalkalibacillus halophilus TaxID=392827 RepID=UPI000408CB9A|nr:ABC transporter permease [Halalkalibacillus halophilus]